MKRIVKGTIYAVVGLFAIVGLATVFGGSSKSTTAPATAAPTQVAVASGPSAAQIESTVAARVNATVGALPKPTAATAASGPSDADIESTVTARVNATVAALPKPTSAPVAEAPKPAPTAAPATAKVDPITVSGRSSMKSKPVTLAAGSYSITWTDQASRFGGNFMADLQPTSGDIFGGTQIANEILAGGAKQKGETEAYNLKAGTYYVAVIGDGDWSITITPQS